MPISQKMTPQMGHAWDLRTWLKEVEDLGQLERIAGAHWDLEIGALTEIILERLSSPPALVFEKAPGYLPARRILVNMLETVERTALTVNLPFLPSVKLATKRERSWNRNGKGKLLASRPPALRGR